MRAIRKHPRASLPSSPLLAVCDCIFPSPSGPSTRSACGGAIHDGEDIQLRWVARNGTSGEVDHGVVDSVNISSVPDKMFFWCEDLILQTGTEMTITSVASLAVLRRAFSESHHENAPSEPHATLVGS